jgi:hypothetical protein
LSSHVLALENIRSGSSGTREGRCHLVSNPFRSQLFFLPLSLAQQLLHPLSSSRSCYNSLSLPCPQVLLPLSLIQLLLHPLSSSPSCYNSLSLPSSQVFLPLSLIQLLLHPPQVFLPLLYFLLLLLLTSSNIFSSISSIQAVMTPFPCYTAVIPPSLTDPAVTPAFFHTQQLFIYSSFFHRPSVVRLSLTQTAVIPRSFPNPAFFCPFSITQLLFLHL